LLSNAYRIKFTLLFYHTGLLLQLEYQSVWVEMADTTSDGATKALAELNNQIEQSEMK